MKKRRTVADSVANIGESGDRDRCLGTSVAYLGVIRAPSYLADAGKARPDPDPMQAENADSAGLTRFPIRPATFARSAAHAQ